MHGYTFLSIFERLYIHLADSNGSFMHCIRKTLLSLSVNLGGLPILWKFSTDPVTRNLCHSLCRLGWDILNVIETALCDSPACKSIIIVFLLSMLILKLFRNIFFTIPIQFLDFLLLWLLSFLSSFQPILQSFIIWIFHAFEPYYKIKSKFALVSLILLVCGGGKS